MRWIKVALVVMCVSAASLAAGAQADVVKSISQTDVSLSLYGAFAGATTGDGVQQSPSNAAGLMLGVRHIDNPLVGYEGSYSWNRANQVYSSQATCGIPCGTTETVPVSANAHELTGDWIVSLKLANLRPFGLAGVGMVFNDPASGQTDTHSSNKGVFLYGLGLDWGLLPHIGLRFQYRGNVYHAPDLTNALGSSGAFLRTAEPMIGAYFRF
jgi:opacity protein-like surface antigen